MYHINVLACIYYLQEKKYFIKLNLIKIKI